MKKTLTALAIVAIFAACKGKPVTETVTTDSIMQADSMAMDHNSFTDRPVDVNMNGLSDTLISNDGTQYVKVDPNAPPAKTITTKPARNSSSATKRTSTPKATASAGSAGTGVSSTGAGTETSTPEVVKKKGWSNSAKGAVIGAGTGAVAGAIIGKNKVKGAVVGGLIGAGGGFVVGKVLDKKAENKQ
jgi:hypothetical protein